MALTRDAKLEKKKLAERRRRERLKNNPEYKAKNRQRYYKRKAEGKILAMRDLNRREQKAKREKNRISSRKYYLKKKNEAKSCLDEQLIPEQEVLNKENHDPLEENPSPLLLSRADSPVSSVSGISSEQEPLDSYSSQPPSPRSTSSSLLRRRSARLHSPEVQTAQTDNQPQNLADNIKDTPRRTPSTSGVLRRFKYQVNKEFQLLHRRITELKTVNAKYKKQIERMQKQKVAPQPSTSKDQKIPVIETENNMDGSTFKGEIKKSVEAFFEDDENSQLCPGKKDCITKKKNKKQKRLLMDSLLNLHKKYQALHPQHKISYSAFCKLRPFWVVIPNVNARETCLCKTHENMDLMLAALKRNKIIEQKSLKDVLKSICCDDTNNECLKRICKNCHDKHLIYKEFDDSQVTHYWKWNQEKKSYTKDGNIKTTRIVVKQKIISSPKAVIEEFEKQLLPYMQHVANIISQHRYIKQIKSNLKEDECIIHCDFSENYNAKYSREIQSVHFGASRNQLTLHTVVLYYKKDGKTITKSFCTISESLRHDALAIWEHLVPILKFLENEVPLVDALYFVSDAPTSQYRNRKMFFIMSRLHWHYPSLRTVEWNYSESGHGKGAPDGVGGVLKRTADQLVARGIDITNMDSLLKHLKKNVPGVHIETVSESGMFEKELLMPDLKEFSGTMRVHQALWNADTGRMITMRTLSCGLDQCYHSTIQCSHGLHKGFYNVDNKNNEEVDECGKRPKLKTSKGDCVKNNKEKPVILSNILIKPKSPKTQWFNNHEENLSTDDVELSDTDSFWIPGLAKEYEGLITPKTTKDFVSCLKKINEENSSDSEDYSIF